MRSSHKSRFSANLYMILMLAALVALVMIIAAGITYSFAESAVEESEKNKACCDDYYAAETLATEIIINFTKNKNYITTESDNRKIYNGPDGNIPVIKAGSNITFSVPVNGKETLSVIAEIAGENIRLIQWTIKEDL